VIQGIFIPKVISSLHLSPQDDVFQYSRVFSKNDIRIIVKIEIKKKILGRELEKGQ
jgi:hypothetical protein